MTGKRWSGVIALFALALVLLSAGVLRAEFMDDEHPPCVRYARFLASPWTLGNADAKRAKADFEAHLKEDPDASCAVAGLARLVDRECAAAKRLAGQRLFSRAEKVFNAQLDHDPAYACARDGLRAVARKRCEFAGDYVEAGRGADALAMLTSESLPDARATCDVAIPTPTPAAGESGD